MKGPMNFRLRFTEILGESKMAKCLKSVFMLKFSQNRFFLSLDFNILRIFVYIVPETEMTCFVCPLYLSFYTQVQKDVSFRP